MLQTDFEAESLNLVGGEDLHQRVVKVLSANLQVSEQQHTQALAKISGLAHMQPIKQHLQEMVNILQRNQAFVRKAAQTGAFVSN